MPQHFLQSCALYEQLSRDYTADDFDDCVASAIHYLSRHRHADAHDAGAPPHDTLSFCFRSLASRELVRLHRYPTVIESYSLRHAVRLRSISHRFEFPGIGPSF